MLPLPKWISAVLPVCGILLISAPAAHAQYYGSGYGGQYGTPAQGSLLQDVASGLLSQGQANAIGNRENSLSSRAAKLLRNDGGVLTPNDASKLNKEALSINRQASSEMMNNSANGGAGTGLLGSLFGMSPAVPAMGVPAMGVPGYGLTGAHGAPYGVNGYSPQASYYGSNGLFNGLGNGFNNGNMPYGTYSNASYGRRYRSYGY